MLVGNECVARARWVINTKHAFNKTDIRMREVEKDFARIDVTKLSDVGLNSLAFNIIGNTH